MLFVDGLFFTEVHLIDHLRIRSGGTRVRVVSARSVRLARHILADEAHEWMLRATHHDLLLAERELPSLGRWQQWRRRSLLRMILKLLQVSGVLETELIISGDFAAILAQIVSHLCCVTVFIL